MTLPDYTPRSLGEKLSLDRFGVRTTLRERVVSVDTTRVLLMENNPNRVTWHIINESVVDVRVSTDPTLTASSGWLLIANGGVIEVVYYDDGESVGYQVFAIAGAAGGSVRVREVVGL